MRRIGIIGAMEVEVEKLKARMENVEITRRASMEFYAGTLEGKNVVVVRSGIGKVNAAVCTQILIDEFEAEAVINTGIAGSLNADINIGDLVISTDLVHHDMNAVAFGYPVGQIPQMEAFSFRSDENLRKLAVQACKEVNPDIEVSATYLNKWYAPALEGQATKSLIDSGCDVISHHADSTAGAVTCQENGAFFIPYNSDMSSAAPNAVLTSVRWDTSSYLIMVVQNILDGTPSKIPADYTGTLENGMIYLADINYSLLDSDTAEKVKNAVADAAAGFENGTKHVFCGPLYNQSGKELVKAGEVYIEPKSSPTFGEVLQGIDIKK